jgi:hypothetical protein
MNGICTLANDRVYDQLIALLNSIESIYGQQMPVCIYPYDQQIERIADAVKTRPHVQLYDDWETIHRWQQFARQVWQVHPTAHQRWGNPDPEYYYRMGMHHRFCGFEAPFDRFLYMDADTLLLNSVDSIFERLTQYEWVVYDFQYKDPAHVYEVNSAKLEQIFSQQHIQTQIFCAGFFASRRGLFDAAQTEWLLAQLRGGDAEILYPMAPDQTILNYMAMKSGHSVFNFALNLPDTIKTGNSVTSLHFEEHDHQLYDRGKPLTYLHYIGLPSSLFTQVCAGENIDFPYRDIFLHYRYLNQPHHRPCYSGKPKSYDAPASLTQKIFRKIGFAR